MSKTLTTSRSTLPLSKVASKICIPQGIVSTGWNVVEKQCALLGISFDGWQKGFGSLALAKRRDGMYAAGVGGVGCSIPRQAGKTYTIGWLIFALCLTHPGMLVIWTAHHTRTSTETFDSMKTMAQRPKLKPFVKTVRAANGQQSIVFNNGSRILFGAREQGFGRGFAQVDILVFDEAQILTESALSDMVPSTNAAPNGLVFLIGTPPRPKDPGEAFRGKREAGLEGDPDTLWVEFSADTDCDVRDWPANKVDWGQIEKANPSFPHRTGKTAVMRMRKLIGSNENFKREALGIWDELSTARRKITASQWASTIGVPPEGGVRSLAVAFSFDGARQAVVGVVKHEHGVHANLVGSYTGTTEAGIAALADWIAARWRTFGTIAICGAAGDQVLSQALRDRGVASKVIRIVTTREYFTANAMLIEAIVNGTLTRPEASGPDDALDASVAISDAKPRGRDGSWGWVPTTPDGDETPVEALAVGVWVARANRRIPGRKQVVLT